MRARDPDYKNRTKNLTAKKPRKNRGLKLLTALAALLLMVTLMVKLPWFYIKNYVVKGCVFTDRQELENMLQAQIGGHFLKNVGDQATDYLTLNYGKSERFFEKNFARIKSANIYFRFPSTIVLDVTEKTEVLCLRVSGGYANLDKDFAIIEVLPEKNSVLPTFILRSAITPLNTEAGFSDQDKQLLKQAVDFQAQVIVFDQGKNKNFQILPRLRDYSFTDDHKIRLQAEPVKGVKWRIFMPFEKVEENLPKLEALFQDKNILAKGSGELDMIGERHRFSPDK